MYIKLMEEDEEPAWAREKLEGEFPRYLWKFRILFPYGYVSETFSFYFLAVSQQYYFFQVCEILHKLIQI